MKILSLDFPLSYNYDFVYEFPFGSTTTLLDYDIVLWDPNRILTNYRSSGTKSGVPSLYQEDAAQLAQALLRRKQEFVDFLNLGRTIFIVMPTPIEFTTTYSSSAAPILASIPVEGFDTVIASGENIAFQGNEPFSTFWSTNKEGLFYESYLKKKVGKPFLFIKGTDKVVGCHIQVGNGNIVFIPNFDCEQFPTSKQKSAEKNFINSLVTLVSTQKSSGGDFSLPDWSKNYSLPGESDLHNRLIELETNLSNIAAEIAHQKATIAKLEEHKILFTGSGKALEKAVAEVFESLGFSVSEGQEGRDDLIIKHGDSVAVVEVKGVSKSAAEKHAAQLEKWVAEYYSANGVQAKGILVVNAFQNVPLMSRTEDAFPNQMLDYCTRRSHCLITGLQLLGIYTACQQKPESKDEVISALFNTCGVFSGFSNWQDFLTSDSPPKPLKPPSGAKGAKK